MAAFLLTDGATITCPHAAQTNIISSNGRVKAGGQAVATLSDTYLVSGCPFVPVKPQPCLTIRWFVTATRIKVNGQPVLLQNSTGLCFSPEQIPNGPPNIVSTQVRVKGI